MTPAFQALSYQETEPLTVSDEAFNADDIAVLIVTGASGGGEWFLNALIPGSEDPIGRIQTSRDPRPGMAFNTATAWVHAYCRKNKIFLAFGSMEEYPPDQAPYFMTARYAIDRRIEDTRENTT
jgi:hypothetical protein